jgi:signal transduction histidine kinase
MPRAWATWSLRRRLALIATFAMCLALVVGGLAMYSGARVEENQMLDARLEQLGSTILSLVDDELPQQNQAMAESGIKTRPAAALLYRYQVWTREGSLVMRSHEAPADKSWVDLKQFGFSTVSYGGEEYRTFTLPSRDGRFIVQVAECVDERIDQLVRVTAYCVGFLVLPFGLILVMTWLLLSRALGSIQSIAAQLTNRNPLDVTTLQVDSPPEEMLPILHSLDELFARVGQAISVERRFTSVAAHELRTPLAGLRAHAQLAVSATNAEDSRAALDALMQGVDRASHLLTQLLDIAKIEALSEDSAPRLQPVDLKQIYAETLKDLMPAARKKGVVITEDIRVRAVQGLPFGMFLMLRNLLANAVLYCPPGGAVRFATFLERGRVAFAVDDSGPGIPPADRGRAFERFNRLGQQGTRGVGLGLSIVLMIVELHGAKISLLDSPLGGLRCKVVFGEPIAEHEGVVETQQLVPA